LNDSKAVIFDWGGVLMRTVDPSPRLNWDRRLGLTPGSVERVVHGIQAWQQVQRGELSLDAYWQQVGQALGLEPDDLAQLRQDFYRGDHLDSALTGLIERLREGGILVGLLSNNGPDLTRLLDEMGISQLFDEIVVSADIGIMKPDERAYRAILAKLAISPSLAIFVDDFEQNVQGAQRIGMNAILFTPDSDVDVQLLQWLNSRG
jgi:epoxide hydrolase-like predicted phosphatase